MIHKPIAVKVLARLNLWDRCDRCFWFECKHGLPWQKFPPIFSMMANYTCRAATESFNAGGRNWLPSPSPESMIEAPTWKTFCVVDKTTGLTLRGSPDWIGVYPDGSWHIVDFKTSAIGRPSKKLGDNAHQMDMLYAAQLNGYAWIAERLGKQVKSLSLVYAEPQTNEVVPLQDEQMVLKFKWTAKTVDKDRNLINRLLGMAKNILESPLARFSPAMCGDCDRLELIVQAIEMPDVLWETSNQWEAAGETQGQQASS